MSDFKAKMHQNRFRLGIDPPQTPLGRGSLQRSPRSSWIKGGLLLRAGEGIWEGRESGGKGGEDTGGEGRDRREGRAPQYFVAPPVPVF